MSKKKTTKPIEPPIGSTFLPGPQPSNKELEKTLREHGAPAVYIDWLQAQGAPIGEYLALAAALEGKRNAKKRARLDALALALAMPTPQFATWGTRHGFFEWLRLENSKDWMDDAFDPVAFAKRLFATPLCAALDELRIGILRWDLNAQDVPAVLDEAGGTRWAKSLSRLHLGDVDGNIDMAHHVVGDVGGVITLAFPKLRSLKVHSGSQSWRGEAETFSLAGLALPKLETLVVETCAMTSARLDAILRAKLPALTHLELWFGATDRDAGATLADLAPLLDGKVFPKVKHLGLKNLDFTGELAERLYASKIASRLVTLDLGMGTLDDAYVTDFYVHAAAFHKLEVLDVSDNFLTPRDLRELRGAFGKVKVVSTGQPKLDYADDDDRFVSVHE